MTEDRPADVTEDELVSALQEASAYRELYFHTLALWRIDRDLMLKHAKTIRQLMGNEPLHPELADGDSGE